MNELSLNIDASSFLFQNSHPTPRSPRSLHEKSKPPSASSSLVSCPSTPSLRAPSPSPRFVSCMFPSSRTSSHEFLLVLCSTRARVRSKLARVLSSFSTAWCGVVESYRVETFFFTDFLSFVFDWVVYFIGVFSYVIYPSILSHSTSSRLTLS